MNNSQISIDSTRLLSTRGVLYVMAAVGVAGVQQLEQRLFFDVEEDSDAVFCSGACEDRHERGVFL